MRALSSAADAACTYRSTVARVSAIVSAGTMGAILRASASKTAASPGSVAQAERRSRVASAGRPREPSAICAAVSSAFAFTSALAAAPASCVHDNVSRSSSSPALARRRSSCSTSASSPGDRSRALPDGGDGTVEIAELLVETRQRAQLGDDGGGVTEVGQTRLPDARRVGEATRCLVEEDQPIEGADLDVTVRSAREHALEETNGALVVAETGGGDTSRVEVELRGAHRIAFDRCFFFQRRRQRAEIGVSRQVRHVGRANRPDRRIEPHRALERTARRFPACPAGAPKISARSTCNQAASSGSEP